VAEKEKAVKQAARKQKTTARVQQKARASKKKEVIEDAVAMLDTDEEAADTIEYKDIAFVKQVAKEYERLRAEKKASKKAKAQPVAQPMEEPALAPFEYHYV
jgi:methanogenic corrinoid protein MtbC1